MSWIKKTTLVFTGIFVTLVLAVAQVDAGNNYTLFGESAVTKDLDNTSIRAVSGSYLGFGGVGFEVRGGMSFSDLVALSADYKVADDDCVGGLPHFRISVDTNEDEVADGNVFAYIGAASNHIRCPAGWQNIGNLISSSDPSRYDFTQLGGTHGTYADAPLDVLDSKVLSVQLVVDRFMTDAAGSDDEQTVLLDNVIINEDVYDFEPVLTYPASKKECKNNGWKSFTGIIFKNQSECISYLTADQSMPTAVPTF